MSLEEIRKLIGGYAPGTLTPDERRALMEAALVDQELFDELARDQVLKGLLDDPLARGQLLGKLRERGTVEPFAGWWKRPLTWSLAGGFAAAAVLVFVFARQPEIAQRPEPVLMAKREALRDLPTETAPERMNEAPARQKAAAPAAAPGTPLPAPAEQKATSSEAKAPAAELADEGKDTRGDKVAGPEAAAAGLEAAPPAEKEEDRRRFAVGSVAVQRTPVPVPYRLLRPSASGDYVEQPSSDSFRRMERIRIAFEPSREGHLRVTTASNQILADTDVKAGGVFNVDVRPGETRLTVAFTAAGETGAASFDIEIRRE